MKNFYSLFLVLPAMASLLFGSCTPHRIKYPVSSSVSSSGAINGSLKVEKLKDKAPRSERVHIRTGKNIWRTNANSGYKNGDRAAEVSNAVAKQIDKSGLFKSVVYPKQTDKADYRLSGTIYDYNAMGKVNKKGENILVMGSTFGSVAGTAFGLVGTAGMKSNLQSNVELRDLKIRDEKTRKTLWFKKSIRSSSDRKVHFLKTDKKPVYKEADRGLKKVVSKMVADIKKSHEKSPSRWGTRLTRRK